MSSTPSSSELQHLFGVPPLPSVLSCRTHSNTVPVGNVDGPVGDAVGASVGGAVGGAAVGGAVGGAVGTVVCLIGVGTGVGTGVSGFVGVGVDTGADAGHVMLYAPSRSHINPNMWHPSVPNSILPGHAL